MGVGWEVPQQKVSDQGPPADEQTIKLIRRLFNVMFAGGEVDVQDFAVSAAEHEISVRLTR
jgi:hypothetical protein